MPRAKEDVTPAKNFYFKNPNQLSEASEIKPLFCEYVFAVCNLFINFAPSNEETTQAQNAIKGQATDAESIYALPTPPTHSTTRLSYPSIRLQK